MTTEKILMLLEEFKKKRGAHYGIVAIGLFGSTARRQNNEKSDIDVFVRLDNQGLFTLYSIQEELENLFKTKVDVVSLGSMMRPKFRKSIENDAIYV